MLGHPAIIIDTVCLCASGCALAPRASFPGSPEYTCRRAQGPITIDGRATEPAWERAGVLPFFIPKTFTAPQSRTEARMLYDDQYIYITFKAYDKDIWHIHTKRDENTWEEDVVEAFFKLDEDQNPYYEFEFNAIGVIWDGFMSHRGAAGTYRRWSQWDSEGLNVATRVRGTLNHWQDEDESWTCEVAIPLEDLTVPSGHPARAGDRWKFQLARYDYSTYLEKGRELTSCAPLRLADFHRYEDFLTLVFE